MKQDGKHATAVSCQLDMDDQLWLENMYQIYYKKVYNYVFYRLLDCDAADELTSRIFIKVVEKRQLYQAEKAQFSTWIFTIAKNELVSHYRRRKLLQSWDKAADRLISGQNVEAELIAKEEKQRFVAALKTLPARERSMIAMKYYFDMTYEAIAGHTGLTANNVSVILTRAKAKLRRLCLEDGQQ